MIVFALAKADNQGLPPTACEIGRNGKVINYFVESVKREIINSLKKLNERVLINWLHALERN